MYYSSGYGSYSNPYYAASSGYAGTALDYSQPIQVAAQQPVAQTDPNAAEPPPSPEVQAALKPFDEAREAFRAEDYAQALAKTDEALKKLPSDAALHEFRGLVLFAQGKYKDAAATIYAVLSVGPGWDWTTLSSMYSDIEVYTTQIRALEAYRKQNPDSADAAFVLGYHYLTCGHKEAAAKQFQAVAKLLPNDTLAPQLVKMLDPALTPQTEKPPTIAGAPDTDAPPELAPEDRSPPIEKSKVVGSRKSSRGNAVAIELSIKNDDTFTWKVTQNGRPNTIEGKYEVQDNMLALKPNTNDPPMVGRVKMGDKGGFNFKLVGSGPNDPGLDFGK
jgi:tetratricopeptide (TPR) repeat protein